MEARQHKTKLWFLTDMNLLLNGCQLLFVNMNYFVSVIHFLCSNIPNDIKLPDHSLYEKLCNIKKMISKMLPRYTQLLDSDAKCFFTRVQYIIANQVFYNICISHLLKEKDI